MVLGLEWGGATALATLLGVKAVALYLILWIGRSL